MTSLPNGLKMAAGNKQKAVIEFLHCEGETQSNIAKRLKAVYKDHALDRATVCRWVNRFINMKKAEKVKEKR